MSEETIDKSQHTIQQLRARHNNVHGSQEQKWIQKHVADEKLADIVLDLSIVAFHILSALETGEKTGIELASLLQVTRGGITRAAKKLVHYQLVDASKHVNDQKKIYYSLTEQGQKLAQVHDQMHRSIKKKLVKSLTAKYSSAELETVAAFLQDLYQLESKL